MPSRRDRHGRLAQPDNDPLRRPAEGFRLSGRRRLQQLAREIVATLPQPLRDLCRGADVTVEDVPVETGDVMAPMARCERTADRAVRVIVYRRPLEVRAGNRDELIAALRQAVGAAVREAFGLPSEDL